MMVVMMVITMTVGDNGNDGDASDDNDNDEHLFSTHYLPSIVLGDEIIHYLNLFLHQTL
jgi:hypothetical protein